MRSEMYEELKRLGYSDEEIWEMISQMDFAEDYDN